MDPRERVHGRSPPIVSYRFVLPISRLDLPYHTTQNGEFTHIFLLNLPSCITAKHQSSKTLPSTKPMI